MIKRVDFDEYTDSYNELLGEKTKFFASGDEYFARYKIELVRKHVNTPVKRVLEFGCGIGRNIPFLQEAFSRATVVGSDISRASLDVAARENPGVEFLCEEDNLADIGQFDLIFVAGVFHHIPPNQRTLAAGALRNRLEKLGHVFVFEHNPYNPITRRIVNTCPYDEDAVLLKPTELKSTLRTAGLSVERTEYCLFVPPRFSMLSGLERRLGWLPLGGQYWVQARHDV
ncbi:class I SAM-dependent methyltransferase [Paraburkholderia caribensis]|uniref:Class I SAM-dependent methyltransferase n=1 Tax=Paraburkholderia caribensis TaxID=75105 RepID=A0ABV0DQN2_9BURK|nr:class I SAM-dependent methyltransferase [Paraburkholderia caribensis]MCO4876537.1 class I SAM-dependent methyltransferase [Paraburkholderia caribensis]